jgi:hypothetical protein
MQAMGGQGGVVHPYISARRHAGDTPTRGHVDTVALHADASTPGYAGMAAGGRTRPAGGRADTLALL